MTNIESVMPQPVEPLPVRVEDNSARSLRRVFAVVGHELRTPLAGLKAMTELLMQQENRSGGGERIPLLRAMHAEILRMSGVVNDTLEAARLDSGLARWRWSDFSVQLPCEEAIECARPLVDCEKVQLELSIDPPTLKMTGDCGALRRLVINLLSNACKHTPRGKITVSCTEIREHDSRWVAIAVSDTGEGIDPVMLENIGRAFELNKGVIDSDLRRGSGLGLAIAKGIAEAHGGKLTLSSDGCSGTLAVAYVRADLEHPQHPEPIAPGLLRMK